MFFRSISLFAIMAFSALAAPAPPPSYTTDANIAPAYTTAIDSYTVIQTLHTDVFRWTAALNSTRDAYSTCATDADRAFYKSQLETQFTSLQTCIKSAQKVIRKQKKHRNDPKLVGPVQDCVQEIKFTGDGLIPILGRDVVAPLLKTVVRTLDGLLRVLGPLVGGLLGLVKNLLAGVLDVLF